MFSGRKTGERQCRNMLRYAQSLDVSRESIEELYAFLLDGFGLRRPRPRGRRKRGKLIAFDGHSGAGKDTQISLLRDRLARLSGSARNITCFAQKRNDPFRAVSKLLFQNAELARDGDCSFMTLTAGRRYFVDAVLWPLLADPDCLVLQNRSYLSHVAYHAGEEDEIPALLELCWFDPHPDLALILACDTAVACERIKRRAPQKGGIIYRNERPDYIERVKKNFCRIADLVEGTAFIDSSGDVETVAEDIKRCVADNLGVPAA